MILMVESLCVCDSTWYLQCIHSAIERVWTQCVLANILDFTAWGEGDICKQLSLKLNLAYQTFYYEFILNLKWMNKATIKN